MKLIIATLMSLTLLSCNDPPPQCRNVMWNYKADTGCSFNAVCRGEDCFFSCTQYPITSPRKGQVAIFQCLSKDTPWRVHKTFLTSESGYSCCKQQEFEYHCQTTFNRSFNDGVTRDFGGAAVDLKPAPDGKAQAKDSAGKDQAGSDSD